MWFNTKKKIIKILPVCSPIITTYTQHAHLLSIIGNYSEIYPWIFSNYINIYINKDYSKNKWGDFYFPFPYELTPSDKCKWIHTLKIDRNIINRKYKLLIDFITECLEENYYIRMSLDHSFLSISELNCYHDILIYGIDINKGVLYVSDFFKHGHYSNENLLFDDFCKAFYACDTLKDNLNGLVYLYKVKSECDYQFHIGNIENSIQAYLTNSIPEYWKIYNMENKNEIAFGTEIYEVLNAYLHKQISDNIKYIDIRPFYMILDHKKIMFFRLKYLHELGYYKNLNQNYNLYQMEQIKHEAEKMVNLVIKYNLTQKDKYIDRIDNILSELKINEYDILKLYIQNII